MFLAIFQNLYSISRHFCSTVFIYVIKLKMLKNQAEHINHWNFRNFNIVLFEIRLSSPNKTPNYALFFNNDFLFTDQNATISNHNCVHLEPQLQHKHIRNPFDFSLKKKNSPTLRCQNIIIIAPPRRSKSA